MQTSEPASLRVARLPVVIAGGGPVGLTLAALLSHHGIASLVIEADDGYCTGSRAICVSRRSMEILGWIGADRRIADIGLPWAGGRSYYRDTEVLHFRMPSEPGERFAPMVNIQQYEVEEAAHRAVAGDRAEIRWGTRVTGVVPGDDGVRVEVVDDAGSATTIAADWLVACDGGRSTVRDRLGLPLKGIQYDGRYVIVDIEQETTRAVERLAWFDPPSNPGSTILMHRQPGNVWRIDYQIRDDEDPAEAVKPEHVLPRVQSHLTMIGETAPWKPLWISIYNAKCLTLDDYRHGRVLFAGDAAHLVPIFGVRGLNSGLDDAGNLAWKLASVIHGQASDRLLDSYSTERVHAARENIAYGAKSTEFMAPPHFGFRLMREAALRLALENRDVRSLINPRQSTPVAYPMAGSDAVVGRPAPDVGEASGAGRRYLSQWFGRGFVLLLFDAETAASRVDALIEALHPIVLETHRVPQSDAAGSRYDVDRGRIVLVRPDGYVMGRWAAFDEHVIHAAIEGLLNPTETPDAR